MSEILDAGNSLSAEQKLGQKFTFGSLIRYTFPSVFAFLFMGLYQTVDGVFIDKFAGDIAIAAVNLQMPMNCIYIGIGNMIGIGGDAVISRKLGMKDRRGANETFTRCLCMGLFWSLVCVVVSIGFAEPIMNILGASEGNIQYLRPYYIWLSLFAPSMLLQSELSIFFMTEGRNALGAMLTVVGGIMNCGLDWLLMTRFDMGIQGAAVATGISYAVTIVYGIWYYFLGRKSDLHVVKCHFDWKESLLLCYNGSSDMLTELNSSFTTVMMNRIMFQFLGDNGVSALAVLAYFQIALIYVYSGFAAAVEPILGYHFGSGDKKALRRNFLLCLKIMTMITAIGIALTFLLQTPAVKLFFTEGTEIYDISMHGYWLYLSGCIFVGFTACIIAFFTAMEKGTISLFLSFLHGLALFVLTLSTMPKFMGIDGVWLSWTVAELGALIISAVFFVWYDRKNHVLS